MNHPHEQQAAAMARAGELPDGEQLRECINSGQVSAAQVVAHAEAGELSMSMFASREDYNRAAIVREGGDGLPVMPNPARLPPGNYPHGALAYNYDQMRAYATAALAAERAEVARLRDVLWTITEHNALHFGERHNTVIQGRAAIGNTTQGMTNHD